MSGGLPADELRGLIEDRHQALTAQAQFFRHEQERSLGRADRGGQPDPAACHRPPGGGDPVARRTCSSAARAGRARHPGGVMTVRPIRLFGDPVLREPCAPVTRFDDGLARLVTDLLDTCLLPAGRARRPADRRGPAGVLLQRRRQRGLSDQPQAGGQRRRPGRPGRLPVDPGPVPAGPACRRTRWPGASISSASRSRSRAPGLLARCLQHEVDHLDGHLFLDRLPDRERRQAMRFRGASRRPGSSPGCGRDRARRIYRSPEQAAQPFEGRLGRRVVAQHAELVEQPSLELPRRAGRTAPSA